VVASTTKKPNKNKKQSIYFFYIDWQSINGTVTFKMYNYETDYRGYIVYAGIKQECFERLSLFPILNKHYTFSLKLNLIIV